MRFRDNRSTVWSLTRDGTVLNVHIAYRKAPPRMLDAFATLAREGGIGSARSRLAASTLSEWPALAEAMQKARERHDLGRNGSSPRATHCSATPEQRAYLKALYRYFNATRFGGRLPQDVPVRLSRRMKSALGHMLPGEREDGSRYVAEIAINCDLMLAKNAAERADTLLHEMAHVADYLESGHRGHGRSWQAWASKVGCRPTRLYDRPVAARRRRRDPVTRVPPLPASVQREAKPAGDAASTSARRVAD